MASAPKDVKIRAGLLKAFENHTARFVPQFADRMFTSWELVHLAEQLSKVKVDDFEPGAADVVLWGTATRGMKTYRALLYLCSLGYGPQAMMLARSLVEDALTARWAELHPDEAIERAKQREKDTAHLAAERVKQRKLDLGGLAKLQPLSEAELKAAARNFGQPWTGHISIVKLAEDVEKDWGDEKERDRLDQVRRLHLPYLNLIVHNTPTSIVKPSYPDEERQLYDAAESDDHVAAALMVGFWAFAHLFRVILHGDQRKEFEAFYAANMQSFIRE